MEDLDLSEGAIAAARVLHMTNQLGALEIQARQGLDVRADVERILLSMQAHSGPAREWVARVIRLYGAG